MGDLNTPVRAQNEVLYSRRGHCSIASFGDQCQITQVHIVSRPVNPFYYRLAFVIHVQHLSRTVPWIIGRVRACHAAIEGSGR